MVWGRGGGELLWVVVWGGELYCWMRSAALDARADPDVLECRSGMEIGVEECV